jgi:hypothetical protein
VGVLKYCACECGELRLAVVAVEFSVVVLLVVDTLVYATAFRANITVFVLLRNKVVYRCVLVGKPFCKFKVCHISVVVLFYVTKILLLFEFTSLK